MRRVLWLASLFLVAACRSQDVAPPALRRPIEALPAGAGAVLLACDLQNTWQHVEALQLQDAVRELPLLGSVDRDSQVVRLRAAYRDLEQRSGIQLKDDLLLNVAGGLAGVGFYPQPDGGRESDVLLVAELLHPERFRTALAALRQQDLGSGWTFEDAALDGAPALRLHRAGGPSVLCVEQGGLLVASTRDALVREGLALHAAGGDAGALHEPTFAAALQAIGAHNLVVLAREPRAEGRWLAQAFTWDRAGLHFEHVRAANPPRTETEPSHRDALLGSLPDGLTLACYARANALDLRELFECGEESEHASASRGALQIRPASQVSFPGLPFSPRDIMGWAGDEVALGLANIEPTPLAPIPNAALVLEVRDAEAAASGLRELESKLAQLPLGPTARGFESVQYGGKTYRTLVQPLSEKVSPSYMLDGDVAVVTATRQLMQQIIDTRRTGRRSVLADGSFKHFAKFVPRGARAEAYADQRRLHAAAVQLHGSASLWGPKVAQGVEELERISALLEHFPAGALYVTRDPDRVVLRGWMLEAN